MKTQIHIHVHIHDDAAQLDRIERAIAALTLRSIKVSNDLTQLQQAETETEAAVTANTAAVTANTAELTKLVNQILALETAQPGDIQADIDALVARAKATRDGILANTAALGTADSAADSAANPPPAPAP